MKLQTTFARVVILWVKQNCIIHKQHRDDNEALADRLHITGTPAIMLMREGKMWFYHYTQDEPSHSVVKFLKEEYKKEKSVKQP